MFESPGSKLLLIGVLHDIVYVPTGARTMGMYIHPVDKVMYALSSYMQQGVMGNQSIRISGLMLLHCLGRVIRFLKINSINFSGS